MSGGVAGVSLELLVSGLVVLMLANVAYLYIGLLDYVAMVISVMMSDS